MYLAHAGKTIRNIPRPNKTKRFSERKKRFILCSLTVDLSSPSKHLGQPNGN